MTCRFSVTIGVIRRSLEAADRGRVQPQPSPDAPDPNPKARGRRANRRSSATKADRWTGSRLDALDYATTLSMHRPSHPEQGTRFVLAAATRIAPTTA